MTEKERVKHCIHFENVDRPPWNIGYTSELAKKVMQSMEIKEEEHYVLGVNIYRYKKLDDFFGNHLTFIRNRAVNSIQEVRPDIWRDEWGVLWDRSIDKDIGTPVNRILADMELNRLEVPDPHDERRFAHWQPLIAENQDRYFLVKFSFSLFERAWSLRGMENLLIDFVKNQGFVHDLFSKINDFNLTLLKDFKKYPIDGIIFGDDWGWQRGLLMHPDTWRAFIKPYIARMYMQAHLQGYDVFIHSCGNIAAILDDLVEIGVNVYNPFQPEVTDITALIEKYSGRLAFFGGLSIQKTLPFGTDEEVIDEVSHRLDLARRFGGYIIAPSHDMPPDIPVDNVCTMMETLRQE
jgi:uroporphyrinogen decarboxylase